MNQVTDIASALIGLQENNRIRQETIKKVYNEKIYRKCPKKNTSMHVSKNIHLNKRNYKLVYISYSNEYMYVSKLKEFRFIL